MDKRFGLGMAVAEFIKLDSENLTKENVQAAIDIASKLSPEPDLVEQFIKLLDIIDECDTSKLEPHVEMKPGWCARLNPDLIELVDIVE